MTLNGSYLFEVRAGKSREPFEISFGNGILSKLIQVIQILFGCNSKFPIDRLSFVRVINGDMKSPACAGST